MDTEAGEIGPQSEAEFDADAFLAAARKKHRDAFKTRTRTIKCWVNPCTRCEGYGQAPSPVGYVRCGRCWGSGADPEKWKRVTPKHRAVPKRARKKSTLPIIVDPGVKL